MAFRQAAGFPMDPHQRKAVLEDKEKERSGKRLVGNGKIGVDHKRDWVDT